MYLALRRTSYVSAHTHVNRYQSVVPNVPFWRIPLLFHLSEHTVGLVVDAMRTFGHFPVTLDLLLPAHVASLKHTHLVSVLTAADRRRKGKETLLPLRSSSA